MFQNLNDLDGGALLSNVCVQGKTSQKENRKNEVSANPQKVLTHSTGIWPYELPLRGTFVLEVLATILLGVQTSKQVIVA